MYEVILKLKIQKLLLKIKTEISFFNLRMVNNLEINNFFKSYFMKYPI